ncbi:MAG TPA: hypothetical protein VJY15_13350, partial [Candidatus Acidoferrum sp.]|nr:hypothetical protein [Candidatus Acidoferrum sp.]
TVPNTAGVFIKQKVVMPANKSKLVSYRLSSVQKFRVFLPDVEVKIKEWGSDGPYSVIKPFGGASSTGAEV